MTRLQLALVCSLLLHSTSAQADWIYDMTSDSCSDAARNRIASSVRSGIENSVRRAEASIAPPAPVEQLACLENLMTLDIASFAPTSGIRSLFNQSLAQLVDGNGQLARRICRVAARRWQEATKSLGGTGYRSGEARLPSFLNVGTGLQGVRHGELPKTDSGTINPITGIRKRSGSKSQQTTPPPAISSASAMATIGIASRHGQSDDGSRSLIGTGAAQ
ncbi:MAG: hypothetical protein OXB95_10855 [Rhodobacteraceae bacterium]|nr:hypothetical protein [Paracoccaceae bacterium]